MVRELKEELRLSREATIESIIANIYNRPEEWWLDFEGSSYSLYKHKDFHIFIKEESFLWKLLIFKLPFTYRIENSKKIPSKYCRKIYKALRYLDEYSEQKEETEIWQKALSTITKIDNKGKDDSKL